MPTSAATERRQVIPGRHKESKKAVIDASHLDSPLLCLGCLDLGFTIISPICTFQLVLLTSHAQVVALRSRSEITRLGLCITFLLYSLTK